MTSSDAFLTSADIFGEAAATELISSADLTVDSALYLRRLAQIDHYPDVLALMPNIYDDDDRALVEAHLRERLHEAGLIDAEATPHPTLASWLHALYRPDVEATARIRRGDNMLRLSLVRRGDLHILATRLDDSVLIQRLQSSSRSYTKIVADALWAFLGEREPLTIDPFRASLAAFDHIARNNAPGESAEALQAIGATPRTARALNAATSPDALEQTAEIALVEHHDSGRTRSGLSDDGHIGISVAATTGAVGVGVLDSTNGRLISTPRLGATGELTVTFGSGTRERFEQGMEQLLDFIPAQSWFDTSR